MSSLTNSQWLTNLSEAVAGLIAGTITEAQFITAMLTPTDGWIGIASSDMVLANKISTTVSAIVLRDEDFDNWCAGSSTGGPTGNGEYPLHTLSGGTIIVPSIQKMLSLVTHGADAKSGLGFSIMGGYNPNELLDMIGSAGTFTIDTTQVSGYAVHGATADSTFLLKKNGAAWGEVTFKGGYNAVVTCSFLTDTLANGDAVLLYAPASLDLTLRDFTITIPGV